jgi:hypothetical protein
MHISHGKKDIREEASNGLKRLAPPKLKANIIYNIITDKNSDVRQTAIEAFVKIATSKDWNTIIEMVKDGDIHIKKAGVYAYLKISGPWDHEILLDLLAEQCQGWSEDQLEIFKLLSEVDKRLYCPYYDE